MAPILIVLFGFLAVFLGLAGYCAAQMVSTESEDATTAELPLPTPTPAG